ncbi:FAD-dependent oxidoreductase [Alicyclobacillus acidoterrestris]|uniref:FAD-dependent oxidoreductase n=1 Tax=Alicyclobacillus acidoterrestris (strain ATCC 49025 / DSM 3922 / CIP 106132 / NCIMB 13137 / GD3B) TaxID=1356854 RepID=T0CQU9_ALIAG|nr:FAD-dependent oxidoreductase [Alicyclobacillus acidoterrestris]EPZ41847.1 FAD-dependent pyridine nucleotide-disulfide oxidoreductase [Alicyclobacillus acidoterrestris ATCC 49025]UNO49760.1 FAD-dependent oxidoreductase [Alicyclobacillus acidoterrestris]
MYDIAIIGAGPAGGSAALFSARANKKTVFFDSDQGVTRRALLRNHYGIAEIGGPDLVEVGQRQATEAGAELVRSKVVDVQKNGDTFTVKTEDGTFEARYVILATGLWADLAESIGVTTKPATEPRIKTIVEVDAQGRTNIPGIWAAGTIAGTSVHTIITAGDGARVAINLISEINGERYVDHDVLPAK